MLCNCAVHCLPSMSMCVLMGITCDSLCMCEICDMSVLPVASRNALLCNI